MKRHTGGLLQVRYCKRRRLSFSTKHTSRSTKKLPYHIVRNIPLHLLPEDVFYQVANEILNAKPIKPKEGDSDD